MKLWKTASLVLVAIVVIAMGYGMALARRATALTKPAASPVAGAHLTGPHNFALTRYSRTLFPGA